MLRISKYWMFQSIGWLSFALLNLYIAILTQELSKEVVLVNFMIAALGIGVSHVFRNFILKHNLTKLPTEKLITRVAFSILLMSVVYTLLYYLCLFMIQPSAITKHLISTGIGSFVAIYFLFSLWSIIYFSWTYIENNRKNVITRLKMEASVKDLEIRTIRSSLQPHFIFNSLNSIRALIDENPELARNAITQISNILRNSITNQEITDTLENELKLVNDYLSLEKIRFEERLQYQQKIDPATLTVQIPTMMLQTLVENAIKHGISKSEQGGKIELKTGIKEDIVWIEITNSGSLETETKHENSLGFGIHSTRQRLKLIYGQQASYEINQLDNQVQVLIKIKPLIK
ncbi:MAG: histidine kinase [Bacteroidetes bacterium]|nr:histidine kinase [Bacteroidota bacterium]